MRPPLGSGWSEVIPPPTAPAAGSAPAGFWIRFLAAVIDNAVVGLGAVVAATVLVFVPVFLLRLGEDAAMVGAIAGYALGIVLYWVYSALMESSARQATLGKLALGLAVEDGEGRRLGFGRATARFFGKILSSIPLQLGFVLAAFTDRKRALHDFVAGTRVVRRRPAGVPGLVFAVGALLFTGIAFAGMFAAIAIPNFVRYQLRSKAAEAQLLLPALHAAQLARAGRDGLFVSVELPSGAPGAERLVWSAEELSTARELGWAVEGSTWFTYRAVAGTTPGGLPSYSACAESDLDGDGVFAAVVLWQPALDAAGEVAAPPPAPPCARAEPARPLEFGADDPLGVPVAVTPPDVF